MSYSYWQKHSRDPVGPRPSSSSINGRAYTIVGIMPEGFTGTKSIFRAEVWLPLGVYDEIINESGSDARRVASAIAATSRLIVIGRLKPGVTAEAAAARAERTGRKSREQRFRSNKRTRLS